MTSVGGGAPSAPGESTPNAIKPDTSRQSSVPAGGVIAVTAWVVGSSVVVPDGRERYPRTSRFPPWSVRRSTGILQGNAAVGAGDGDGLGVAGGLGDVPPPDPCVHPIVSAIAETIPSHRAGRFTLCPRYFEPVPARTRPSMPPQSRPAPTESRRFRTARSPRRSRPE